MGDEYDAAKDAQASYYAAIEAKKERGDHLKFLGGKVELRPGDCRDIIKAMPDNSIDSVVTDPPYALVSIIKRFGGKNAAPAKGNEAYMRQSAGFMGKQWDTGETAFAAEFWAEVLRVLKPGGHVVAFSGTRTYHRMAVAIEDAGFEIRDQLAWMYGSGFPKSHDVSKGIDKAASAVRQKTKEGTVERSGYGDDWDTGSSDTRPRYDAPVTDAAREWQGWGTALKPAWEPICLARKPLIGTVAANVLEWGTGAINVDGCRVEGEPVPLFDTTGGRKFEQAHSQPERRTQQVGTSNAGRWPANLIHDGSAEVLAGFPETAGKVGMTQHGSGTNKVYGDFTRSAQSLVNDGVSDSGSAARFFYTAKADKLDRIGSKHPTVKPVDLMQWLVRLVTPKGGVVLDPFAGSGSTGEAAYYEGMRCILCEREPEYQEDIRKRLSMVIASVDARKKAAARPKPVAIDEGDLFA